MQPTFSHSKDFKERMAQIILKTQRRVLKEEREELEFMTSSDKAMDIQLSQKDSQNFAAFERALGRLARGVPNGNEDDALRTVLPYLEKSAEDWRGRQDARKPDAVLDNVITEARRVSGDDPVGTLDAARGIVSEANADIKFSKKNASDVSSLINNIKVILGELPPPVLQVD